MEINLDHTALVITDPQNDFLSHDGVAWDLVKESVKANHTIENMEKLLKSAKQNNIQTFISPHYYFPYDQNWIFEGPVEKLMHDTKMYLRKGPLSMEGFIGSGADFLDQFKPYINNEKSIIVSPHKIYGPESNDLVLQLRKHGISKVILAGMSANLCVESHLRELIENGFEVAVVYDATAGATIDGMDGYQSALVNYKMIANDVWSTDETLEKIKKIK
ncbi:cysteine hydrolase [Chengkuizengella sp. YPA3-1-1]|uniref:Cysteine hydrolase n=2 Tax=Chengkuizengella marina TaxID=2507566 RepID=A0A6N9Q369_9BACL|nr:cysteine hydrolase [Chengkuizengella marina]